MGSKIRLIITTGDPDGVGWEVTAKALNAIGPQTGVQFFFYRSLKATQVLPKLSRRFKHQIVSSMEMAQNIKFDSKTAVEIRSSKPPALWVEESAKACLQGAFQGLVTAPLSKTSIIESGLKDIGHTEILSRVSNTHDLFMAFLGSKFNVLLATGHFPLLKAIPSFTPAKLRSALRAAESFKALLPKAKFKKPIAVLGVNPHAGENGLLGDEEAWMIKVISESGLLAEGPLVPDAAFLPQNWKSYSVYVCPYHDQGLIPFKMIHGFKSGVHLTMGLPFVRTSVDHGTAKELFGKNKADPGSMKDALLTAIRLCKKQSEDDLC